MVDIVKSTDFHMVYWMSGLSEYIILVYLVLVLLLPLISLLCHADALLYHADVWMPTTQQEYFMMRNSTKPNAHR